ncbi:hypothetical protein D030_3162B, partial [Vibrio parahaemolyticus AQ3810]
KRKRRGKEDWDRTFSD